MSEISAAVEPLAGMFSGIEEISGSLSASGNLGGSVSYAPTNTMVELPELTNPATAAEIVLGYQAIDKNSYRLTGTLDLDALKEESYSEGYAAAEEVAVAALAALTDLDEEVE